jgi:hypothetical protein
MEIDVFAMFYFVLARSKLLQSVGPQSVKTPPSLRMRCPFVDLIGKPQV